MNRNRAFLENTMRAAILLSSVLSASGFAGNHHHRASKTTAFVSSRPRADSSQQHLSSVHDEYAALLGTRAFGGDRRVGGSHPNNSLMRRPIGDGIILRAGSLKMSSDDGSDGVAVEEAAAVAPPKKKRKKRKTKPKEGVDGAGAEPVAKKKRAPRKKKATVKKPEPESEPVVSSAATEENEVDVPPPPSMPFFAAEEVGSAAETVEFLEETPTPDTDVDDVIAEENATIEEDDVIVEEQEGTAGDPGDAAPNEDTHEESDGDFQYHIAVTDEDDNWGDIPASLLAGYKPKWKKHLYTHAERLALPYEERAALEVYEYLRDHSQDLDLYVRRSEDMPDDEDLFYVYDDYYNMMHEDTEEVGMLFVRTSERPECVQQFEDIRTAVETRFGKKVFVAMVPIDGPTGDAELLEITLQSWEETDVFSRHRGLYDSNWDGPAELEMEWFLEQIGGLIDDDTRYSFTY
mmetsp:Transcript_34984/g.68877  ORF Transcript_34984/g.68877 Transcript_34984/m.68877 type:complete len:462 (-) Transcript_34984:117-1502(-)